jgi:hypothetical protein
VQIGDLGYVQRGHFTLIFNVTGPLGGRTPGEDVPLDFVETEPLGPVQRGQPREPGPIYSRSIRREGASAGGEANA